MVLQAGTLSPMSGKTEKRTNMRQKLTKRVQLSFPSLQLEFDTEDDARERINDALYRSGESFYRGLPGGVERER